MVPPYMNNFNKNLVVKISEDKSVLEEKHVINEIVLEKGLKSKHY